MSFVAIVAVAPATDLDDDKYETALSPPPAAATVALDDDDTPSCAEMSDECELDIASDIERDEEPFFVSVFDDFFFNGFCNCTPYIR